MRFVDFYEHANNGSYDGNLTLDQYANSNSPKLPRFGCCRFQPIHASNCPPDNFIFNSVGFFHDEDEMQPHGC